MPNRPNPQQEPESECCQETHHHHLEYLKNRMPTQQEMDDAAELFKVFGDSTRARIICALTVSELCVCDLSCLLNMSQSAISHQLRSLKQSRLVKARREGKTVFYSLADGHVRTILDQGMEHVAELLPLHILFSLPVS